VNELEQVSESLVLRSLGLHRLFREIGTYLEFVAIARGG
jgi:hypothetical protein